MSGVQNGTYHSESISRTLPRACRKGFAQSDAYLTAEGAVPVATAFDSIRVSTKAKDEILDITGEVQRVVSDSGLRNGLACVFVAGSTAAVTTVEHEPGLVADLQRAMERLFPRGMNYEHHRRWGDGNGHSHVRASYIGPSLTVPVVDGGLQLGTWQQIVFMELDNKPRTREILVQVVGDA
ncbi:MAG: YjbQ family protein [Methanobacteriota archaeon]|nr:MAG: YjbQ family protein [Euryarchaeota archaeon]